MSQGSIWNRLRQSAALNTEATFTSESVTVPWYAVLALVREYTPLQIRYSFRFVPIGQARSEIERFTRTYQAVKYAQHHSRDTVTHAELSRRLRARGFTRRRLTEFQGRDLASLLTLHHGANFSVPGAGKTTVTFALHVLLHYEGLKLFVISPKSAFSAWTEVIQECIGAGAAAWAKEPFTVLTGSAEMVRAGIESSPNRLIMNYEQLPSNARVVSQFLAQHRVHLVLDESHRIKGGYQVQRASVLLRAAPLAQRRDILSGTPMPQSSQDLQSQLDFLWPGSGLSRDIRDGTSPRAVIGRLYVRTTKEDLGLPPVVRSFRRVPMGLGQRALYGIVKSEALRDLSSFRLNRGHDILKARRSVMRLLQLSANPVLALNAIMKNNRMLESGLVAQVLDDGPSPKMIAVRDHARQLAAEDRKSVIWTIFTDTIQQLERMLADLEPVSIYGAVASGDADNPQTREGRLRRFHEDPSCMVLIANPAAAGEGISLHKVCHDAIYLDRSYNATHYLQSIDRIHRLGLSENVVSNIYIFQTMAPKGLGSIDHSVSRRLRSKMDAMYQLLDDPDLYQLSLDEEESEFPIDHEFDREDLEDLIMQLSGTVRDHDSVEL